MLNKLKSGHWPIFMMSTISSMTNLLLPIVLVRLLTPKEVGIYKIFFLYVQAIPFIAMSGAPLYSVYYWIGKGEQARDYLKQAWLLTLILGTVTTLIGLLFINPITSHFNIETKYVVLLLLSSAVLTPAAFYGELLIAKGLRFWGSFFNTSFEVSKAIIFIFVAYMYGDVSIIFITYTVLFSTKLIVAIYKGYMAGDFRFLIDVKRIKEVITYCFPMALAGTLGFFVDKVDMILLSSRIDAESFAYYSIGCLMIPPLIILDMSVQKVLIPKLSKSYHDNHLQEALTPFVKAQSEVAFLVIPAVVGLYFFAEPIIEMLFTSRYLQSATYLKIFALGYLTYIFPHDAIPRASGKTGWILKIYLAVTPLALVTVYIMAGYYGAIGALTAAISFKFVPKALGLIYSAKVMNWPITKIFPIKQLSIYTAIALVLTIVSYQVRHLFEGQVLWFIVCGPIFAGIYLSVIYLLKSHTQTLDTVR